MENALIYTFILLLAELFEAHNQRSQTLLGVLDNLYAYYAKSIFLFFLMHPGFYVVLGVVMATGVLNLTMGLLIAFKVFDMFYKIELIKKVYIRQEVSPQEAQMLEWQLPSWFFLAGAGLYPFLLFYALV